MNAAGADPEVSGAAKSLKTFLRMYKPAGGEFARVHFSSLLLGRPSDRHDLNRGWLCGRMLATLRSRLDQMKIVLGSQSPRRRELLAPFFAFEVVPSNFDESTLSPSSFSTPSEFVRLQAQKKCEELAARLPGADMIITADTIVFIDNTILGKPGTHECAYEMIKQLSNRMHTVETGVFITLPKIGKSSSFSVETKVYFDDLSEEVIRSYADSDDPLDKAGAYGIQSGAMSLIRKIEGEYSNVVGLPVNAVCREIARLLAP
jgi:septum formation protein